jgi:hypothetical protein
MLVVAEVADLGMALAFMGLSGLEEQAEGALAADITETIPIQPATPRQERQIWAAVEAVA